MYAVQPLILKPHTHCGDHITPNETTPHTVLQMICPLAGMTQYCCNLTLCHHTHNSHPTKCANGGIDTACQQTDQPPSWLKLLLPNILNHPYQGQHHTSQHVCLLILPHPQTTLNTFRHGMVSHCNQPCGATHDRRGFDRLSVILKTLKT